jgi:hypothetical protein
MFNSSVLDVAIGLVFVYLLLGLMCTTVNEWIAQAGNTRGKILKEGIRRLLHAPPDGTYLIRAVDINLAALTKRFSNPEDKLTKAVGEFKPEVRADIITYAAGLSENPVPSPPPALAGALADQLSAALKAPDLNKKIDDSKVTQETRDEFGKQPKNNDLLRLNRALLSEAYPDEITSLSDAFYSHPLIKSLARSQGKHPSYVPAKTFALTLMDIFSKGLAAAGDAAARLGQIETAIAGLPESDVKVSVQALMRSGNASVEEVQKKLEEWFEGSMDRVSGWYKKRTQVWTIVIASAVTIFANADTINITQKLMINPALRAKIAEEAAATAKNNPAGAPTSSTLTPEQKADLSSLTGWTDDFRTFHRLEFKACTDKANAKEKGDSAALRACGVEAGKTLVDAMIIAGNDGSFPGWDLVSWVLFPWLWAVIPRHLLGWVLTAIAASLGAPFWFDTLNKFMNVRPAGSVPDEKKTGQAKA